MQRYGSTALRVSKISGYLAVGDESRLDLEASHEMLASSPFAVNEPSRLDAGPCRSVPWSRSTPKPIEFTAIAFRWFAFPRRFEMRHRFTLLCQL